MIVRPYLTIHAKNKEEAKQFFNEQKFSKNEFLETCFPASNMEIDKISETTERN